MRSTCALRRLLVLTALVLPLAPLSAQRYWHDDQGIDALRLDLAFPFLKGGHHKFPSVAAVPSVSFRAAEAIRVEGDFPLMRAGYDFGTPTGSKSTVRAGNPYVGLRIGDDTKAFSGTLGVRLPLGRTPKDAIGQRALEVGQASTFDDYEAFVPEEFSVKASLESRWVTSGHMLVGAKLGGSILINTSGNPLAQDVKYIDYGGRVGYSGPNVLATFALTGRLVSQSPAGTSGFSARTHHAATGAVELHKGMARPRISLRIPFDKDLRDQAGAVLGVGVTLTP